MQANSSVTRTGMADAEWQLIAPLLPSERGRPGRPARDDRLVLEGILRVLRTGASWPDLPDTFGKSNGVFVRFSRWTKAGLWDAVLDVLTRIGLAGHRHHRSTAQRYAPAGARRAPRGSRANALGRSRGGYGTKVHLRADANGLPLGAVVTPGEAHETTAVEQLAAVVGEGRRRCWAIAPTTAIAFERRSCFAASDPSSPRAAAGQIRRTTTGTSTANETASSVSSGD